MPFIPIMDPLQDTWYGINYTGTQITQCDSQNKGTLTSPARLSFGLKVPLCHLRPNIIYSVPYDRILQRAYPEDYNFFTMLWYFFVCCSNVVPLLSC